MADRRRTLMGWTVSTSLRFRHLVAALGVLVMAPVTGAAILALLHDALLVLGLFAMLGYFFEVEIDSLFVTAVRGHQRR